jgi:hypothetical protein
MLFHVYVRRGIVYVPTVAQREGGAYTDIEPVAVEPITNIDGLRRALAEAIAKGNIIVSVPKGKWPAPVVLKYAGVKTWSAFARDASSWSIEEDDDQYRIVGYRKHPRGYWQQDSDQQTIFPPGTTVDKVIDRMIEILHDTVRKPRSTN